MSQYIEYKDRDDRGQKLYRCDVCGKIGLWSVVHLHGVDRCEECHATYIHDKLVSEDYERADREGRYTGD